MDYVAKHLEMLAKLREKGAPAVFNWSIPGAYNERTDTDDPPTEGSVEGRAVEVPGDPEELQALELITEEPVTLFFVPNTIGQSPPINSVIMWAGAKRTVRQRFPIRPTGTILAIRVILI